MRPHPARVRETAIGRHARAARRETARGACRPRRWLLHPRSRGARCDAAPAAIAPTCAPPRVLRRAEATGEDGQGRALPFARALFPEGRTRRSLCAVFSRRADTDDAGGASVRRNTVARTPQALRCCAALQAPPPRDGRGPYANAARSPRQASSLGLRRVLEAPHQAAWQRRDRRETNSAQHKGAQRRRAAAATRLQRAGRRAGSRRTRRWPPRPTWTAHAPSPLGLRFTAKPGVVRPARFVRRASRVLRRCAGVPRACVASQAARTGRTEVVADGDARGGERAPPPQVRRAEVAHCGEAGASGRRAGGAAEARGVPRARRGARALRV